MNQKQIFVHSKIDPKDLRPMKASEFKIGGYFYRKNDDGTFSVCCITEYELSNPASAQFLRLKTQQLSKEQKLFVRISNPWKPFEN